MLFEKIKKSLRISHDLLDDDIQDLIDAAKMKMAISGVFVIDDNDPLVIEAIKTYCKGHIGLMNDEAERYQMSFQSQVEHLALTGDYNEL